MEILIRINVTVDGTTIAVDDVVIEQSNNENRARQRLWEDYLRKRGIEISRDLITLPSLRYAPDDLSEESMEKHLQDLACGQKRVYGFGPKRQERLKALLIK